MRQTVASLLQGIERYVILQFILYHEINYT